MKARMIDQLCHALVKRCKTYNPFEIADMLDVSVEYDDIGKLKGYYCFMNRVRLIVINRALDDSMKRLVCAHELGHDRLHFRLALDSPLRDEGFGSAAKAEIEANCFVASLLIPDEEFIELACYGYTDRQIAMELETIPEIVQIKTRMMNQKGMQLRMPDMPKSTFLK
jgi:Zn-dependent peptidase ImmA (M78 family)